MDKFTEEYIKSIINEEVDDELALQNSTELLDEDQCNLIGESFGNWFKNFWRTGSGKNKMLLKLIMEFANEYKFKSINDDPNYLGKCENGYNIYLNIKEDNLKSNRIVLKVKSPTTNKSVIPATKFNVKYSWTLEELADKINDILLEVRIQLTKKAGPIKDTKNNTKSEDGGSSTAQSIDGVGGYSVSEIKNKLNDESGTKDKKLSVLKQFIAGWKKLSDEERELFEKLK